MSDKLFDQALRDWLEDGSDRTPPPAIDAVLLAVKTTPQERDLRIPRRFRPMTSSMRLVAGVAIIVIAGAAGLAILNQSPGPGVGPSSIPSPTALATIEPTSTAAAQASLGPIDTSTWATYNSNRYGFTIAHPPGWAVVPASRGWTFETDAINFLSPAQEAFVDTAGPGIRVSAWSVALEPGATVETWADVEAWAASYCQKAADSSCTGIPDRAVHLCNEPRDCHPGVLVPFDDDVLAFFTGGNFGGRMVVVAVWWGESDAAVAPFGGSTRLLKTFLSTMGVVLPSGPDNHP